MFKILESIFNFELGSKKQVVVDKYPDFKLGFKSVGFENRITDTTKKAIDTTPSMIIKNPFIGEPKVSTTVIAKEVSEIDNTKRQGSLGVTEAIARDFFSRHGKFDSIKFRIMSDKYAVENMSSLQKIQKA